MELRWTSAALDDLDQAHTFIADENPAAAGRVASNVLAAVESLLTLPNLGRPGRVRDTRELVVSGTPLIVVYRVRLDQVQILRILHHARAWQE